MGSRDSELAVLIEDTQTVQITMNGQPFTANVFAHNFRVQLWSELLASSKSKLIDPISAKQFHRVCIMTSQLLVADACTVE